MKVNKIVLSTTVGLCTLLLAGNTQAQAAGTVFQDTNGHWAANAIERMSGYHIVNGYAGNFRPNDTITRGEMAVILTNVMKYQQKTENTFSDLGQAFYTDAILKAGRAGVLYGADGKVRPTDAISRQEAVAMMARAFDIEATNGNISVSDANDIANWAKGSVCAFMQKGYIDSTNAFRPTASITRAEVVTILNHLLSGYYDTSGSFSQSANGTVVVNTQDVVLKDAVIDGDLILSEGVKDGNVTLENVTVKGRTLIRGGGANSIHVVGNSVLSNVVMERDNAAVRIAVEGNAKVGNITVGKKSTEAIVTGNVPSVTVAGSAKLTAQNAQIDTISVMASDASVALSGQSVIKNVEVADNAKNTDISVAKNATINTIQIQADGAKISGEGKVSDVKANANNIAVNTNGTKVSAGEGTSNVTVGGQNVKPGNSSTANTPSQKPSSGSGSSSSGGGGGGHRPSRPEKLAIAKVESVENGLVRMTLNHASDKPLTKDQFTIICTGAGKNMTILSVETKDNIVYDLHTAFYNDNTYQLGLKLEDGTLLTYNFESKYDCPAITDQDMTRTTTTTADFFYKSDIAGTFYYMLKPEEPTSWRVVANDEPTAEDIIKNGVQTEMKANGNTFQITQLKEHTAYTMYYVAKGIDEKVTSVKSLQIASEPTQTPPTGAISIDNITSHRVDNPDFFGEHIYLKVALSQPTDTQLTSKNFKLNCPKGDIPLGSINSSDKQNYEVFIKAGHVIDDTNFTLTITFDDGTTAVKKFSSDLSAPTITVHKSDIVRFEDKKASVIFTTSEAGKMYWTVLKGSDFDAGGGTPKNPKQILDAKHEIKEFATAGTYSFDIDFTDKAADVEQGLYFCFFGEDALGNRPFTFDYVKIPDAVTPKPDKPEPEAGEYQIVSITGSVGEQNCPPFGTGHILTVTMNKNDTGFQLFSNSTVKITGNGEIIFGTRKICVAMENSLKPEEHSVSVVNTKLSEGDYTFEAVITNTDQPITKSFHVDKDGNITSK